MKSVRKACGSASMIVAGLMLAAGVWYLVANVREWNEWIWLLDPGKYVMHLVLCPAAALLVGYWFRKVHEGILQSTNARTSTLVTIVVTAVAVSCCTAWGNVGVYSEGGVGTIVYPTDLSKLVVSKEPTYDDIGLAYQAEEKAAAQQLHRELIAKIWPGGFHAGMDLPHVHNKAAEWYHSIYQAKKGRNHVMAGVVALSVYDACRKTTQGTVGGLAVLGILSTTGIIGMFLNMIGVSMCILLLMMCLRHASLRRPIRAAERRAAPSDRPGVRQTETWSLIALFVCAVVLAVWLPCIRITDHFISFDSAVSAIGFGLPLALAVSFAAATLLVTTLDAKTTAKIWKAGALLLPAVVSALTALVWPYGTAPGVQFGLLIIFIVVGAVFVPILLHWAMSTNLAKVET